MVASIANVHAHHARLDQQTLLTSSNTAWPPLRIRCPTAVLEVPFSTILASRFSFLVSSALGILERHGWAWQRLGTKKREAVPATSELAVNLSPIQSSLSHSENFKPAHTLARRAVPQ